MCDPTRSFSLVAFDGLADGLHVKPMGVLRFRELSRLLLHGNQRRHQQETARPKEATNALRFHGMETNGWRWDDIGMADATKRRGDAKSQRKAALEIVRSHVRPHHATPDEGVGGSRTARFCRRCELICHCMCRCHVQLTFRPSHDVTWNKNVAAVSKTESLLAIAHQ